MDDDLASLLMHGYNNPDPGADEIYGTSDVSRIMHAQKAAKEREGQEAAARLVSTAIPVAGVANRVASSNVARAVGYHNRLEQKMGNPMVNSGTLPFLVPYLALMAPSHARVMRGAGVSPGSMPPSRWPGLADEAASFVGSIKDRPGGVKTELLAPHIEDTANILNQLEQMSSRAPKYKALY